MPRYIDADWITQKLEGWQYKLSEKYGWNDEYVLCLAEVLMKLDDTPTADVVEVVECKDCVHYWKNGNDEEAVCLASPKDDAFCSEGERRDDGENNS